MRSGFQPVSFRLAGEAVARHRRNHQIEGVLRCARAMGRGIRQWIDDLQLLDDRAGPSVRDDERQRIFMFRTNVDEVNVDAIDRRHELRQGIELTPPPFASRSPCPSSERAPAAWPTACPATGRRRFPCQAIAWRRCAGGGRRVALPGTLTRNGRMTSPAGAAASCDGSRIAAPATAMPIVAMPKSRRRWWSISSAILVVSMVCLRFSRSCVVCGVRRGQRARRSLAYEGWRSDRNAARISAEKSSGTSQAAKCPPLSSLL